MMGDWSPSSLDEPLTEEDRLRSTVANLDDELRKKMSEIIESRRRVANLENDLRMKMFEIIDNQHMFTDLNNELKLKAEIIAGQRNILANQRARIGKLERLNRSLQLNAITRPVHEREAQRAGGPTRRLQTADSPRLSVGVVAE
jgi:hypothetical protein